MNCPKAPALIPAITDFLGIKDLRSDQMLLSSVLFNPLHSNISRCILHSVLHTFLEKTDKENLFYNQELLKLIVVSSIFILLTSLYDSWVIL